MTRTNTKDPLSLLRNRRADTAPFRSAARKVTGRLMRKLRRSLEKQKISQDNVVPVVILRSGMALLDAALREFPGAPVGVFGMKRDEKTFAPHWYYENLPRLSRRSVVILLDPMLATGGSAEASVKRLLAKGAAAEKIYFVGLVAAPEGLKRLSKHIPRENIILAAVDRGLDARKYIVPGLGDFGDRYFGYGGNAISIQ